MTDFMSHGKSIAAGAVTGPGKNDESTLGAQTEIPVCGHLPGFNTYYAKGMGGSVNVDEAICRCEFLGQCAGLCNSLLHRACIHHLRPLRKQRRIITGWRDQSIPLRPVCD